MPGGVLDRTPLAVERIVVPSDGAALPLGAARNAGAAHLDCDVLVVPRRRLHPEPRVRRRPRRRARRAPRTRWRAAVSDTCGAGWQAAGAGRRSRRAAAIRTRRDRRRTRDELDTDRHELFWSLNFAVRAPTWQRLGGFDTGYRGYGAEDTDLGLRARRLGIPLLWVAGALGVPPVAPADPPRPRPRATRSSPTPVASTTAVGTWPMAGWLDELAAAGAVRFDPAADVLERWRP